MAMIDCVAQSMMKAGAAGFLIKQTAANDLLKDHPRGSSGNVFFSPSIAKRLPHQGREAFTTEQSARKGAELSSREAEVLQLNC